MSTAPVLPNKPQLKLHIPEPKHRPGDKPDFSHIKVPKAGEIRKPDINVAAKDTLDIAYSFIRVLGEDDKGHGPWDPKVDVETLKRGLKHMVTVRAYDARMFAAQRQGKTSFYMNCTGEEAIAVAPSAALDPEDMCFPTYRQQGLLISRGYPWLDMMCQVYSNERDPLKGRQLPIMYSSKKHGKLRIVMSNAQKPQNYREVIDALVRMCHDGQGQIGARRVREGLWNKNASESTIPEQHQINLMLERLSSSDRAIIADLLAHEVVIGVFETLKVLEEFQIEPFTDGYEGSPYHDFVRRLDKWNWPEC